MTTSIDRIMKVADFVADHTPLALWETAFLPYQLISAVATDQYYKVKDQHQKDWWLNLRSRAEDRLPRY